MRVTPILLSLCLPLAACGSGNPRVNARDALNSGDYSTAISEFDEALAGLTVGSPDYVGLSVDRCRALAYADAEQAKDDFVALASSADVELRDFTAVVSELVAAAAWLPAIDLVDAGMKRFPEEPGMLEIKVRVIEKSKESGNEDALKKLKGIGYI